MNYKLSELHVMKSAAGYYLGYTYFDEECQCWFPSVSYTHLTLPTIYSV